MLQNRPVCVSVSNLNINALFLTRNGNRRRVLRETADQEDLDLRLCFKINMTSTTQTAVYATRLTTVTATSVTLQWG